MEVLSTQLKLLQDKSQEKRNMAMKDIEQITSTAIKNEAANSIQKTIDSILKNINNQNPIIKKSGLFAITSVTVALAKESRDKMAPHFVVQLTQPVLEQMNNADEGVRKTAVDCLHKQISNLRELSLLNFNSYFEYMLQRAAEHDNQIKNMQNQLDQFVRNTVTDCHANPKYFKLDTFIPVLKEKMRTKQTQLRNMIILWVKTLHMIEQLKTQMFLYFPQIQEGLFNYLGEGKQLREQTDELLGEYFRQIESFVRKPVLSDKEIKVTEQILHNLTNICSKGNNYAKLSAVLWIFEYLRIYQSSIEPLDEEAPSLQHTVSTYKQDQQQVVYPRKVDSLIEIPLKQILIPKIPHILEQILNLLSHEEEEIRRASQKTNDALLKIIEKVESASVEFMNVIPIVKHMLTQKNTTAESALVWMNHLLRIYSEKLMPEIENILSKLIEKLNDAEGQVLQKVMMVVVSISTHEQYFDLVIDKILKAFHENREIISKRGEHIIKRLCSSMDPLKVYGALCLKLVTYDQDIDFVSEVVQKMDQILVTDRDLQELRQLLRNFRFEETKAQENLRTFETLFLTFSYNPVSTITLCLLAEEYELAYKIITSFAEVELDMETLMAIGKLVNFLETAIFVYLRIQLLEHEEHPYLLKCLQGLMMLLPQGVAFTKLKQRLKNVKQAEKIHQEQEPRKKVVTIDHEPLLQQFRKIRHRVYENRRDKEDKEIYQL